MTARASVTLYLVLALVGFVAITGVDWPDYWTAQVGRAALTPREHFGYAVFTTGFFAALATIGCRWMVAGWIGSRIILGHWLSRLRLRPGPVTAAGVLLVAGLAAVAPRVGQAQSLLATPPDEGGPHHQLTLTLLPDAQAAGRRLLVVARPWYYCYAPTAEVFRVPPGYVTDLASVPDAVQPLVPTFGSYAEASVLHDWLYAVRFAGGRKQADRVMLFAMRDFRNESARTNPYQAWLIYKAVRLFGWRAYYFGGEREWAGRWAGAGPEPARLALAWRGKSPSRCARFKEELDSDVYEAQFVKRLAALHAAEEG
ncbi:DUF1353 domain-containing protein [Caulobacter sp. 17J65-9]|uniref:DUF1353 domain-containing protein n=1 Tax=Caulobacter sp. 17J65-9 TaxID=2709382 RepID=UPI0013C7E0A1|nr:DUF1353 domain-containing protein [Caulobacter sp. 17J65-9]NEX92629.1 DUF1353 domain-containing protein [Caulobacter sp. 17J65-9]